MVERMDTALNVTRVEVQMQERKNKVVAGSIKEVSCLLTLTPTKVFCSLLLTTLTTDSTDTWQVLCLGTTPRRNAL